MSKARSSKPQVFSRDTPPKAQSDSEANGYTRADFKAALELLSERGADNDTTTTARAPLSHKDLKELQAYGYQVVEDKALSVRDQTALWDHNRYYSNILSTYTNNMRKVFDLKLSYKKLLLIINLGILVLMSVGFAITIALAAMNIIKENVLEIILTALAAFLTTFIVIPHTITKYLFNEKEEENMCKIVENIQNYDTHIRDGINDLPK